MPGICSVALNLLKERSEEAAKRGKELIIVLLTDEMAIRKGLSWDGKQTWGQVDLGDGVAAEDAPLAKEAMVFMAVSVGMTFKIPLGFHFIAGLSATQKSELVTR